jgi:hypothetical protein
VHRADGPTIAFEDFVEDHRRWWRARWDGDPRARAQARRALLGPVAVPDPGPWTSGSEDVRESHRDV